MSCRARRDIVVCYENMDYLENLALSYGLSVYNLRFELRVRGVEIAFYFYFLFANLFRQKRKGFLNFVCFVVVACLVPEEVILFYTCLIWKRAYL